MYRHTTPTPLKFISVSDEPDNIDLINSEFEAECVWGDYPGSRTGLGFYSDISFNGTPVGRLWRTETAVGLLHVPLPGNVKKRESELHHWNAAMDIRKSFHDGVSAAAAFASVLTKFQSTTAVYGDVSAINFPEMDDFFYQGRYDPTDTYIWCEEMQ
jgi:hypothetical protein